MRLQHRCCCIRIWDMSLKCIGAELTQYEKVYKVRSRRSSTNLMFTQIVYDIASKMAEYQEALPGKNWSICKQ